MKQFLKVMSVALFALLLASPGAFAATLEEAKMNSHGKKPIALLN